MKLTAVYTIGHGRHPFAEFLSLLQKHEIEFVCDVRNYARSRWGQFNGAMFSELLQNNRIGYEHLPECGGKKIATTAELSFGIERILELAAETKTAIMCSESQPLTKHKVPRANCHRVGLLAPLLKARGAAEIIHILPNGTTTEFDESKVESIW